MNFRKEKIKLDFAAIVVMLIVIFGPNKYIGLSLAVVFLIGALFYLYKHNFFMADSGNEDGTGARAFKEAIALMTVLMVLGIIGVVLSERNMFTESTVKIYANAVALILIVGFGRIAERIPINGFIGIRLPWLMNDEKTWNFGHRLLARCSTPLAVIYLALIPFVDIVILICGVIALWIAIPGIGSYIFYKRKYGI